MTRPGLIMNLLAAVLLLGTLAWGIALYPGLPDVIPSHWNAAGEADGFSEKSLWSVFGTLLIGAVSFLGVLATQLLLNNRPWLVPAEERAYSIGLGYVNLSMTLIFCWAALMSWLDLNAGPLFMVLSIMAGLPVLVIIGLHLPKIREQRKALHGPAEPSMDPQYWVWGGMFYRNPADPRTIVPRPPHMGVGGTFNLASRGGRLAVWLSVLLLIGLILLPLIIAWAQS